MISAERLSPRPRSFETSRGPASRPRASCMHGTTASRAGSESAVDCAPSHSTLCAGMSPYATPISCSRCRHHPRCRLSSSATLAKSRKNASGRPANARAPFFFRPPRLRRFAGTGTRAWARTSPPCPRRGLWRSARCARCCASSPRRSPARTSSERGRLSGARARAWRGAPGRRGAAARSPPPEDPRGASRRASRVRISHTRGGKAPPSSRGRACAGSGPRTPRAYRAGGLPPSTPETPTRPAERFPRFPGRDVSGPRPRGRRLSCPTPTRGSRRRRPRPRASSPARAKSRRGACPAWTRAWAGPASPPPPRLTNDVSRFGPTPTRTPRVVGCRPRHAEDARCAVAPGTRHPRATPVRSRRSRPTSSASAPTAVTSSARCDFIIHSITTFPRGRSHFGSGPVGSDSSLIG